MLPIYFIPKELKESEMEESQRVISTLRSIAERQQTSIIMGRGPVIGEIQGRVENMRVFYGSPDQLTREQATRRLEAMIARPVEPENRIEPMETDDEDESWWKRQEVLRTIVITAFWCIFVFCAVYTIIGLTHHK